MKETKLQLLLTLYNLKPIELARICDCDRSTMGRIVDNTAQLIPLTLIAKLPKVLNVSLDFIFNNENDNAIKIHCDSFSKDFYISFYEYLILRLHDVIKDELTDSKTINHILPTEYSYIFDRANHIKENIQVCLEDKIISKTGNMILFPTTNKTYYNTKIRTFYRELFLNTIADIYGPNYHELYFTGKRKKLVDKINPPLSINEAKEQGRLEREEIKNLRKEITLELDCAYCKITKEEHTTPKGIYSYACYLNLLDNFPLIDLKNTKIRIERDGTKYSFEEVKKEENRIVLKFYDLDILTFHGDKDTIRLTGKEFYYKMRNFISKKS